MTEPSAPIEQEATQNIPPINSSAEITAIETITQMDARALFALLTNVQERLEALSQQEAKRITADAERSTLSSQIANDLKTILAAQERAEQIKAKAEDSGQPAEAAAAEKVRKLALSLLLLIVGETASALWQSFVESEVYRPLVAKAREVLDHLGKTVLGPVHPPAVPAPQPIPMPSQTRTPEPPSKIGRQHRQIEFDWVTIPAGDFLMGSNKHFDKDAYDDETPQHRVFLPTYQIARIPVTCAQFAVFCQATGYDTNAEKEGNAWVYGHDQWGFVDGASWYQPTGPGSRIGRKHAQHPVTVIAWQDALAFCAWARAETGQDIRLPTEAEWEKAARGTDGRLYPWGNRAPTAQLCNFDERVGSTTPAGQYPGGASPYGVLDMAGNVWEWCSTLCYDDNGRAYGYPYRTDDGREDLSRDGYRAQRGGSWYSSSNRVRCACRNGGGPGSWLVCLGFRLARSLR